MRERLVPLQQLMTARTVMQTSFHHNPLWLEMFKGHLAQNTNMYSRQSNLLYVKVLSGYFFHSNIISYFFKKDRYQVHERMRKNRKQWKDERKQSRGKRQRNEERRVKENDTRCHLFGIAYSWIKLILSCAFCQSFSLDELPVVWQ